jgi:hypothetical protein
VIRFLAFGGTIASVRPPGSTEVTPTLGGAALMESVPELAEIAEVDVQDFAPIASFAVTLPDMLVLAKATVEAFSDGREGVVISHGTDTIEETAYALALMLRRGQPIVLTGAMRNPTHPTRRRGRAARLPERRAARAPTRSSRSSCGRRGKPDDASARVPRAYDSASERLRAWRRSLSRSLDSCPIGR